MNERRRLEKRNKSKSAPSSVPPPALSAELINALEQAIGHHQAGRLGEAETLYRKVLSSAPENALANHLFGVIAHLKGDPLTAIEAIGKSLVREPDNFEAHKNMASALIGAGRLQEAEQHLLRSLDLKADYAEALNNLSFVQSETGRFDQAIKSSLEATRIKPDYADAHNSLGNALMGTARPLEAVHSYRRALELNPGHAQAWNNLGLIEKDVLALENAEAAFRNAIALKPDFADAHNNLGMLKLLQGNLQEGFAECQWRVGLDSMRQFQRQLPGQAWAGQDPAGKRLLIYAEQGLGDTLHFVRYLPLLKELGCELFFECQPPLLRLLTQMNDVACIFAHGEAIPVIDLHAPLMSLPHLLGTTTETIPAPIPYLRADPALVEIWRQRLSIYQGLRVGIVWRGGIAHRNDKNRSASFALFKKYFTHPGMTFFSLQKELLEHEQDLPESFIDLGLDFAETAAAISNMDLIITVDTALAHLAGSMGIPTYVLLSKIADWRWLLERTDTPWYPGMTLLRQTQAGDWDTVLSQIASTISSLTGK